MSDALTDYWPEFVLRLRARDGLTQAALASILGLDQTAISRWERGLDTPSLRIRRRLRDLFRASGDGRQDALVKLRVQFAGWPMSIVRPGAIFLETSPSLNREVGAAESVKGRSIYGRFGERADAVTRAWERTGIFNGELALTLSLNETPGREGPLYFRGVDTPHFSQDGEIWCVCEIKRIEKGEYESGLAQFGGPLMSVPFDNLGA